MSFRVFELTHTPAPTFPYFHTSIFSYFHRSQRTILCASRRAATSRPLPHFHTSILPYFHTSILPYFHTSIFSYSHRSQRAILGASRRVVGRGLRPRRCKIPLPPHLYKCGGSAAGKSLVFTMAFANLIRSCRSSARCNVAEHLEVSTARLHCRLISWPRLRNIPLPPHLYKCGGSASSIFANAVANSIRSFRPSERCNVGMASGGFHRAAPLPPHFMAPPSQDSITTAFI